MTSPNENYTSWHCGMKLVCVASAEKIAAIAATIPGSNYPNSNGVYTIREIRDDSVYGATGKIVVLLVEIDNSHFIGRRGPNNTYCYVEPGFNVVGFRPVVSRPTSIAIFQRILSNPRKKLHTEDA